MPLLSGSHNAMANGPARYSKHNSTPILPSIPMIHALPGIGANTRMYPAPWDTLPGIRLHDWPKYQGETSLPAVAAQLHFT